MIAGAAGRDFHNFNVAFRGTRRIRGRRVHRDADPEHRRAHLPAASSRGRGTGGDPDRRPSRSSSSRRPHEVDEVVFAYSDVSHEHVMHIGSRVLAAGRRYRLIAPAGDDARRRRSRSSAICAVRTGSGKSQTTRHVAAVLRDAGKRVAVLRHPMPYGDLTKQAVQRFEQLRGPRRGRLHDRGARGVRAAPGRGQPRLRRRSTTSASSEPPSEEADVILWDGGNNDTPFIRPDVHIVVVDPHRAGPRAAATTPARRTCAWPTSASSTRSTRAPQEGVDAVLASIARAEPDRREIVLAATRRSRSRATPARSSASACSRSRTARP